MDPTWYIYLVIFIGPFVQEDAAIIAAATLSASSPSDSPLIFLVILLGLFFSDIWKYWIGYSAHASARARRWAEKDRVMTLTDRIERNAVITLLAARFLPFARIPAYIACGYFKMNYLKFCAIILATALIYVGAIFAIIHLLGEVFGDKMEIMLGTFSCIAILVVVLGLGVSTWLKSRRKTN